MATVSTLQRVEVMDRFRRLLLDTSQDPDLTVVLGPPRDPQQGKLVVIGDVTGSLEVAHLTAGRKEYDDRFEVEILCVSWDAGGEDHTRSDYDCQAVAEHVRETIADRPRMELVVGGDGMDGVVSVVVGDLDGPNRWWNPEGVGTAMRVTVEFHVRID